MILEGSDLNFAERLQEKTNRVNQALKDYSYREDNAQKTIYEAMSYSLCAGGKRIRPVLVLACAELFGDERAALPFACALEMIHTYSLIHDDLPCMDNDALRRGKPTNHMVFGEAMALLAGDALLTRAFEISVKCSSITVKKTANCIRVLAEAAGTEGMIGGQVIDMENEEKEIDAETLHAMHRGKTGALIVGAVKLGAVVGGANEEESKRLVEYAENLGLAFQIKDDILDVEGNVGLLGKNTGMDAQMQKTTFVSLYGMEKSKEMLENYTQRAKEALNGFGARAEFLLQLADYLLRRDR